MEISMNAKTESPVKDTLKAGAAGAMVLGGAQVGKNLAPVIKQSYASSIKNQNEVIDKFVKSGKTVEEYMHNQCRLTNGMTVLFPNIKK